LANCVEPEGFPSACTPQNVEQKLGQVMDTARFCFLNVLPNDGKCYSLLCVLKLWQLACAGLIANLECFLLVLNPSGELLEILLIQSEGDLPASPLPLRHPESPSCHNHCRFHKSTARVDEEFLGPPSTLPVKGRLRLALVQCAVLLHQSSLPVPSNCYTT
jgi:hypothetical protein